MELLTAILCVACYVAFGFTWLTLKSCIFCFLIVGLIFMDAETGLLPHEFTYSGIGIGLALAWFASVDCVWHGVSAWRSWLACHPGRAGAGGA